MYIIQYAMTTTFAPRMRLLAKNIKTHITSAKKYIEDIENDTHQRIAGAIIGLGGGVWLNDKRIQNTNQHVRYHMGDDMPKYPAPLRYSTTCIFGSIGFFFGGNVGVVGMTIGAGLLATAYTLISSSSDYDKQCEDAYNARKFNFKLVDGTA